MSFIYNADPERGREWQNLFRLLAPDIEFRFWPDSGPPEKVYYLGTWAPLDNLERFPNLKIIFSLGAGVDQFNFDAIPPHVPLVRMQEPGIVATMQEYVTMAVMMLHRDMIGYIAQQRDHIWETRRVLSATRRHVGILGLGQLGSAVAKHLSSLGFVSSGWSRSPREIPGVSCFSGDNALADFLSKVEILICLLPLTDLTRGILNAELFGQLPRGASLINVGRGAHLVETDLLEALGSGQLSAAVLDVFDPEPPPQNHPVWSHPQILLTPHVGSMTQPGSATEMVIDNIRRHQAGQEMIGTIDRQRGY